MSPRRPPVMLAAICGVAAPILHAAEPTRFPADRTRRAFPVGHIYYNIATGERVATPYEQRPRSTSGSLWINNNTDPCATGATVGVIDTVEDPIFGGPCLGGTFPCEGTWNVWWGDIPFNTVVDCVVTAYAIAAPDLDADSDSIGDGIVGYDLALTFSDNDNGMGASARSCILDLTIPTLAGVVGAVPPGTMAVYALTLDFASIAPSFIFELGDLNGIDDAGTGNSGGAIYGHPTGRDLDADSRADFSYAMRFDQSSLQLNAPPGMSKGDNGYLTVAPKLGNPGDLPTIPADAVGLFDAVDIYTSGPSCPPDTTLLLGTFFFGGFTCAPPTPTPHASAYLELYGPACACNPCPADLAEPFFVTDFNDVVAFLVDFNADCTGGIGDFDYSAACNFDDVIGFLTTFTSPICGN